jgi:superfamily I DNA/RNA helicase
MQKEILKFLESEPRLSKGNLQIIACAGSGKTEFISIRVAYMIPKGIAKPENIVAFTYTERAAEELKFRICSIRVPDYMALTNNLALMPNYSFEKMRAQLSAKNSGSKIGI